MGHGLRGSEAFLRRLGATMASAAVSGEGGRRLVRATRGGLIMATPWQQVPTIEQTGVVRVAGAGEDLAVPQAPERSTHRLALSALRGVRIRRETR